MTFIEIICLIFGAVAATCCAVAVVGAMVLSLIFLVGGEP